MPIRLDALNRNLEYQVTALILLKDEKLIVEEEYEAAIEKIRFLQRLNDTVAHRNKNRNKEDPSTVNIE